MAAEDIVQWDQRCIVCGKSVEGSRGMCHLDFKGRMVAICCPLCMRAFKKDPDSYIRRIETAQTLYPNDIFGQSRLFND